MSAFEAHEHRERAEEAHEKRDPFVNRVSITIALLAVSAAIVGSLEALESAASIRGASQAVLFQDKATDAWNEYQADSLKRHLYTLAADRGGPDAARYRAVAGDQQQAQAKARAQADAAQQGREERVHAAEIAEKRHHWLTAAAALLEIGIGVSSVAIITAIRPFWYGALALGAVGAVLFAVAWIA